MTFFSRQAIPLQRYVPSIGEVLVVPKEAAGRPIARTSNGKYLDTTGSNTDGIQEAINYIKNTEGAGGTVRIAPGIYSVSDILIDDMQGFRFVGSGALGNSSGKGTILQAKTGATNVLKVLNCEKTTIENFTFDGNSIATTTLLSESTNAPVSTENRYKNLSVKGGTQIDIDVHDSGSSKQNDITIFDDIVVVSSGSVAAVRMGGQNVQLLTWIGGAISAIGSCPYDVLITGGYANFYGTFFNGSNNSASAYIKTSGGLRIFGGAMEGMTTTGVETASGGSSFPVLIQGCFYAVTENTFVSHAGAQSMVLINNSISTTTTISRSSAAGQLWDLFTDRNHAAPVYGGTGADGIHFWEDNAMRVVNDDAGAGIILKRNAATAAEYQWMIDSSGNLLLDLAGSGTFLKYDKASNFLNSYIPVAIQNTAAKIYAGSGTPEGAVTAAIGSIFMRTDGGAGTSFYVKESGAGNTGWVGK